MQRCARTCIRIRLFHRKIFNTYSGWLSSYPTIAVLYGVGSIRICYVRSIPHDIVCKRYRSIYLADEDSRLYDDDRFVSVACVALRVNRRVMMRHYWCNNGAVERPIITTVHQCDTSIMQPNLLLSLTAQPLIVQQIYWISMFIQFLGLPTMAFTFKYSIKVKHKDNLLVFLLWLAK